MTECFFSAYFWENSFWHSAQRNCFGTPHSYSICRLSNCFRYLPLYWRPQFFGHTAGSILQISSTKYLRCTSAVKTKNWYLVKTKNKKQPYHALQGLYYCYEAWKSNFLTWLKYYRNCYYIYDHKKMDNTYVIRHH